MLAYTGIVNCPLYTTQIGLIPSTSFYNASINITLCDIDEEYDVIDNDYDKSCQAYFVYQSTPLPRCDGNLTIAKPSALESLVMPGIFVEKNKASLVFCCQPTIESDTSPVTFQLDTVYSYQMNLTTRIQSNQSIDTPQKNNSKMSSASDSGLNGMIHITAVNKNITSQTVRCTMTVSNFTCSGNNSATNTTTIEYPPFMDADHCEQFLEMLNNATSDSAFFFSQSLNNGKIVSVEFVESNIRVAQVKVNFLKLLDFEFVPGADTFSRLQQSRFHGVPKTVRYTKLRGTTGSECWKINSDVSHLGHTESDHRILCTNSDGLASVDYVDAFAIGAPDTTELPNPPVRAPVFLGCYDDMRDFELYGNVAGSNPVSACIQDCQGSAENLYAAVLGNTTCYCSTMQIDTSLEWPIDSCVCANASDCDIEKLGILVYDIQTAIDEDANDIRVPNFVGNSTAAINNTNVRPATPDLLEQLGFSRLAYFQTAKKRSVEHIPGLVSKPLNWKEFSKVHKPRLSPEEISHIFAQVIANPRPTKAFIALREIILDYPEQTIQLVEDYLANGPGAIHIDQVIFGALSASFSGHVERLFMRLFMFDGLNEQRTKFALRAAAQAPPHTVSDDIVGHLESLATHEHIAKRTNGLNYYSMMAGQFSAHNDKRSERMYKVIEQSLIWHEKIWDERGVMLSLNALGNTRSRDSIPHLKRYLHQQFNDSLSEVAADKFNQVAANGLRSVPGEDVHDILLDSMHFERSDAYLRTTVKSLKRRSLSPAHTSRLRSIISDLNIPPAGSIRKNYTKGDENIQVIAYSALDWNLDYKDTLIDAQAGVRINIFQIPFDIIAGRAFWESHGISDYVAILYLDVYVPNPSTGFFMVYSLLDFSSSEQLPIKEFAGDAICDIPNTVNNLETAFEFTQTLLRLTYYYGLPLLFGVDLSFEVTGALSLQYGYSFYFENSALSPSFHSTQFRASVVPGGQIDAAVSATLDLAVAYASIEADLLVAKVNFPVTVAAQLDGSTSCYSVGLESEFLSGSVTLSANFRLCLFNCHKSYSLFEWKGFSYNTNLLASGCDCSAEDDGSTFVLDDLEFTNDTDIPLVRIPRAYEKVEYVLDGREYNDYRRPLTVAAIIYPRNVNARKSKPTTKVTDVMKEVLDKNLDIQGLDGPFNSGHIIAASLGGSNGRVANFFVQLRAINGGGYKNIETGIADCLKKRINTSYRAKMDIFFTYANGITQIPNTYTIKVRFELWRSRENVWKLVPHQNGYPQNCYNAFSATYMAEGEAHIYYRFTQLTDEQRAHMRAIKFFDAN
eukprot:Phypoly_transcript_00122.p1 GENE.Phypoly_transcript_00122~~Phypoly_transcript_00122.p1  ORF type:complete len:1299 (+),score=171.04 Phypoly_transcript_00122:2707-6603(+)